MKEFLPSLPGDGQNMAESMKGGSGEQIINSLCSEKMQ
jgi:hypothetical protein